MRRTQLVRVALSGGIAVALLVNGPDAGAQTRTAEPFTWQGQVATGRTIEVKGVNGSIRAVAASGPVARVEAARTARRNDPEEVSIIVLEHAAGITVCAIYPGAGDQANECRPGDQGRIGARNSDVQVNFPIHVPASVHLQARTTNGSVTTENLTARVDVHSTNGDIHIGGAARATARTTNGSVAIYTSGAADARTTNGRITAYLTSVSGSDPLHFSTTNGSITLSLPAGASAALEAATANGTIQSDFPVAVQGVIGPRRLSGTIGSGGPTIQLRTTNGSIRLERGT
jgi:hypothetical protein